jgi:hypothetical protein
MGQQQQKALVLDLGRSLRNPDMAQDAQRLLKKLRERHDLLAITAHDIDELLDSRQPPSQPTRIQDPIQKASLATQNVSFVRRALLLFLPANGKAWLIHVCFYFIVTFCLLGLLGLAIEPYDSKTGESTWAYGLLGLVFLFGLPLFVLQRAAMRIHNRG